MHLVYPFRHSPRGDDELRFSLRSVARHAPWVGKVWIFGDCPAWLAISRRAIEHVPHDEIAWVVGARTPVVNTFLMLYLVALMPEVANEFFYMCDDFILLDDLSPEAAMIPRYVEDLDQTAHRRGTGPYKDALWRTYDLLKQLGYPRLNYEAHVPTFLTKRRVLAAVRDFRSYLVEDRFAGPLAQLAILNHARQREGFTPILLQDEGSYAGFHFRPFPYDAIREGCVGKQFLNFDDAAYNDDMRRYLAKRFPTPCRYEREYEESA